MCGIVGYYTYRIQRDIQEVLNILFQGLTRLEYRGYDSAGIAFDISDPSAHRNYHFSGKETGAKFFDDSIECVPPLIIKQVGKVISLRELVHEIIDERHLDITEKFQSQVGIAHTRWATHGHPSAINSHPHSSSSDNEFVVVHNGIITNFNLLKDFLVRHGETFISETDTEVIPKLCKFIYNRLPSKVLFPKLIMEVMKKLEGASAILVKSVHYPGELVAFKRGSPLIVGINDNSFNRRISFNRMHEATDSAWLGETMECWLASDSSALIEHTRRVIVLEDNDVLHLAGGGYGIYNMNMTDVHEAVPRELLTLQSQVEHIMKNGYDHYMQKEIHEQPESLLSTMRGRVRVEFAPVPSSDKVSLNGQSPSTSSLQNYAGAVDAAPSTPPASTADGDPYLIPRVMLGGLLEHGTHIKRCRRIVMVACGTSFHACLATRQTLEELIGIPVSLELASDFLDRRCPVFRDDTCIFLSQSGETADTLCALEYAKGCGALTVGVTNTVGSAISRSTHCGVHLNAGYEIGVASTKAYTCQIVAVTMMALQLSEDSIARRARRDKTIDALGTLPLQVRRALQLDAQMRQLAEELKDTNSLLFFGRGHNYATALEAALKVKEVALIHSEGILAGEMKHGPLALVDRYLPIVVIATRDNVYTKMDGVIQQLLAREAKLYILCGEDDESMSQYESRGCVLLRVPETVDFLQPIVNIVPLQLLSYHLTVLRGFNVDQPRNLAKSVTVSEEMH